MPVRSIAKCATGSRACKSYQLASAVTDPLLTRCRPHRPPCPPITAAQTAPRGKVRGLVRGLSGLAPRGPHPSSQHIAIFKIPVTCRYPLSARVRSQVQHPHLHRLCGDQHRYVARPPTHIVVVVVVVLVVVVVVFGVVCCVESVASRSLAFLFPYYLSSTARETKPALPPITISKSSQRRFDLLSIFPPKAISQQAHDITPSPRR
ncbi:hypothetical protein F5B22DRAFT_644276 [Xylaria bambusicola]|uniref:uncharacterized protein n=1 Tax=Xylaria bambusicola TaxID=326684 RepID=UPI002008065D|nr:uncharacterized protein F5B22DRAFT_644276 [Xylaria bambusicola]KAI0521032.1 hypothetical protein F5B22DRAFT_644276 [Xylaria bambusicola]